jgi:hypothetical protein
MQENLDVIALAETWDNGKPVVVDLGERALLRPDAAGEVAEMVDGERDVGVGGLAAGRSSRGTSRS